MYNKKEKAIYELIRNNDGLTARQLRELSGQEQANARINALIKGHRGADALVHTSHKIVCPVTKKTVSVYKAINQAREYYTVDKQEMNFVKKMNYVLGCALDKNNTLSNEARVKIITNITHALSKKSNMYSLGMDVDFNHIGIQEQDNYTFSRYITEYYKILKK